MQFLRRHIYLMRRGEESAQQEIGVCRSVGRSVGALVARVVRDRDTPPAELCMPTPWRSLGSVVASRLVVGRGIGQQHL